MLTSLFWLSLILFKTSDCEHIMYEMKQITQPVLHAEGPHWDPDEGVLYFVDTTGQGVHRYDPKDNSDTALHLENPVGTMVPIRKNPGKFVIGYGRNITVLEWDGKSTDYKLYSKYEVDHDKPKNRFNDGKADKGGNLWIGTMGAEIGTEFEENQGSLYRVTSKCGQVDKVVTPVGISNGMAWNSANNVMYYIDSLTGKIGVFDYDEKTANIANRRTLFDFATNDLPGFPDGMTIDTDDNLWVACYNGSKVIHISKTGKLLLSIEMPVSLVTSVAWGGPKLDILYVTTMKHGLTKEEQEEQPLSGAVFSITGLGVNGTQSYTATECLLSAPTISCS